MYAKEGLGNAYLAPCSTVLQASYSIIVIASLY
jgi:hypothetical protein